MEREKEFLFMSSHKALTILSIIFIGILAVSLRFFGLFHDFWFDEIWSYVTVSQLKSPLQIFSLTYDNNHFINSFFIYFSGKNDPSYWFKYRLLSFISGLGTISIAFLLARKMFSGTLERLIAPLLMATSFPFVVYSTEARGYSPEAFFSLASFFLLLQYFETKKIYQLIFFNCFIILGFFSHLSFIYMFVGLFVFSLIKIFNKVDDNKTRILTILKLYLLPCIIVPIIYIPYLLKIAYGYGPEYSLLTIANHLAAYLAGYQEDSHFWYIFMGITFVVLLTESILITKNSIGSGIFFITIILLPITFCLVVQPKYFNVRYLFFLYPFLIILLTSFLVRLASRSIICKLCSILLILLILFGNFQHIFNFIKSGRGSYLHTLSYLQKHTDSDQIIVSGDHTFRNLMVLSFYSQFVLNCKELVYIIPPDHLKFMENNAKWFLDYLLNKKIKLICLDAAMLEKFSPEWFIVAKFGKNPEIADSLALGRSAKYKMEQYFPYSGELSGYHWYLYHKVTR